MIRRILFAVATLLAPMAAHAQMINSQSGTTYTFLNTDCSKVVLFTSASSIAATLPQASSQAGGGAGAGTFMPPCRIEVIAGGAGTVTVTPTTSTIGGTSTLTVAGGSNTNHFAVIISDGANYQVEH